MALRDNRDLYDRTEKFLEDIGRYWNEGEREAYIGKIFYGCEVEKKLTYSGNMSVFVYELLKDLDSFAPCIENEPLIVTLLNGLKEGGLLGFGKEQTCNILLSEIKVVYQITDVDSAVQAAERLQQPPTQQDTIPPNPSATMQQQNREQDSSQGTGTTTSEDDDGDSDPGSSNNQGGTGGNGGCWHVIDNTVKRLYEWWKAQPTHRKWLWGVFVTAVVVLAAVASPILPFFEDDTNTSEPIITTETPEETPSVMVTDEQTEDVIVLSTTDTPTTITTEAPIVTNTASEISTTITTEAATTDTPVPSTTQAPTVLDTPITITTEAPTTPDGTQQTLPITIYVSAGYIAIYIPDNPSSVSLEHLIFVDGEGTVYRLNTYPAFSTYFRNVNINNRPVCLLILDPTKNEVTPRNCQNNDGNDVQPYLQTIANIDIFWWRTGTGLFPFIVTNDADYTDICSDIRCPIIYVEPPSQ